MAADTLPFDCALPAPQRAKLEELWREGFVRLSGLLGDEEVGTLAEESRRLMQELPRTDYRNHKQLGLAYRQPILFDRDWSVLSNLVGLSPRVDATTSFASGMWTSDRRLPACRGMRTRFGRSLLRRMAEAW